jgi:hypothetical protein
MKDPQNPKDTNLTGGKGKGKGGRKTFIDDITSKSESAAQQPKLQKEFPAFISSNLSEQGKKFGVRRQFKSQ